MSHKFSVKSGLLSLSLGLATAFAVLTPAPEAQAGDKVECSKLKEAKLKGFCEAQEGKAAAIKKVMKEAQKAYKAAGKGDIDCKTCHETGSGGALKKSESDKLWPDFKGYLGTAIDGYKK